MYCWLIPDSVRLVSVTLHMLLQPCSCWRNGYVCPLRPSKHVEPRVIDFSISIYSLTLSLYIMLYLSHNITTNYPEASRSSASTTLVGTSFAEDTGSLITSIPALPSILLPFATECWNDIVASEGMEEYPFALFCKGEIQDPPQVLSFAKGNPQLLQTEILKCLQNTNCNDNICITGFDHDDCCLLLLQAWHAKRSPFHLLHACLMPPQPDW